MDAKEERAVRTWRPDHGKQTYRSQTSTTRSHLLEVRAGGIAIALVPGKIATQTQGGGEGWQARVSCL